MYVLWAFNVMDHEHECVCCILSVQLSVSLLSLYTCTYTQQSKSDCSNFDDDFTMEDAKITPPDESVFKTLDQTAFLGFSYTNERFRE